MSTVQSVSVSLLVHQGETPRSVPLQHFPFTIGRGPDRDLVLTNDFISRQHARITQEQGSLWIEDTGSRHGTLRNGQPVVKAPLQVGDRLHLGGREGLDLSVESSASPEESLQNLLSSSKNVGNTDLGRLNWLLEAARRLNATGGVDEVLSSLIETTLALTRWERGYVFLCEHNELRFACARDHTGQPLAEGSSLSRTALRRALETFEPYILTDSLTVETGAQAQSVVVNNIRAIIAMPLRRRKESGGSGESLGVLYLDSRLTPGVLSETDHGLLRTVAAEAAMLVENAQLARAEDDARRDREELAFAASIQQSLMAVHLPRLDYAAVNARNLPCRAVGGDFFDVVDNEEGLSVVIADVSGKGASAAILAATLQGMLYSQLATRTPLATIAKTVNTYLCTKKTGKYATLVVARVSRSGHLEFINCGHISPLLLQHAGAGQPPLIEELTAGNVPVGLLEAADFTSGESRMHPGDTLLLASDGITEAEDATGEFFGLDRFFDAARSTSGDLDGIFTQVQTFCGATPSTDDRTVVCLRFHPAQAPAL